MWRNGNPQKLLLDYKIMQPFCTVVWQFLQILDTYMAQQLDS